MTAREGEDSSEPVVLTEDEKEWLRTMLADAREGEVSDAFEFLDELAEESRRE